jgi:hypothetical protein
MAEKATVDIDVNVGEGAKSLRTLKQEFKDLQKELDNVVVGTDEYKQKLQELANVKDEIDDLNDAIGAQTGAGKFEAIAKLGSSLAGGFSAAQGAMALFGSESEDVQKALLKVQGAMAFAQGLSQLEDLGNAFKNAKTVVLDFGKSAISAFRSLFATMLANPIMAIVAGLTLLTAAVVAFMMAEDDETEALKANIAERERSMEVMDRENAMVNKGMKARIDLMKARGATDQEIFVAEQKMNAERIKQLQEQNDKVRQNLRDLKKLRDEADGDELKELNSKYSEQSKLLDKNKSEIFDIEQSARIKQAQLDTKAKQDEKARQKTANEKAKALLNERLQAETNAIKQLADLKVANIKDDEERELAKLKLQFDQAQKANADSKASEETKNAVQLELERKYRNDLTNLLDKFEQDRLKKEEDLKKEQEDKKKQELADAKTAEEKRIADELTLLEIERSEKERFNDLSLDTQIELENQRFEILRNNKYLDNLEREKLEEEHLTKLNELQDAKAKIDEERQARNKQFAIDSAQETLQTLQSLTTAFAGKSEAAQRRAFEINKAAQIAETIIGTYSAAQKAYASQIVPGDPTSPIRATIAAGLSIAAGLARLKQIKDTKFESKSASGGAGGGGSVGSTVPAMGQTVGNTTTNIENLQNQGTQTQQPVKAVVVQTEMANVNQQVNRIEERSKIN